MFGVRIRTGYSFRCATGMLTDVMQRLVECKYSAAPITDRASTFGYVRWSKLAVKNNLPAVFGVELAVTKDSTMREKKNSIDYWTFMAIDDIAAVNKLVQLATSQFYYEAIISYQQAVSAEGVIKIAGYRSDLSEFEPAENLYVSLAPSCAKGYIRDALNRGHKLAACSDNKWTSPTHDDQLLYETIVGRETSLQSYDQFIQTHDEWFTGVRHKVDRSVAEQAMANSLAILQQSTAQLKKSTLLTPEKPMTLRAMCEEGAKKLGCDLSDPVYAARLDRELAMIEEKGFEDYFYVIADICQWARARMLVGQARGSSAGSLVCFLLEITKVDPITFKLIFERFVDVQRKDLPDIDIDFSDQHRAEVFEYMSQKFGADHVCRVGSVAVYKGPSALNEAGAALRVPRWKCNAVAESLLKRSSGDARALDSLEDTFNAMPAGKDLLQDYPEMKIVTRMEGHPRHHSQHAAGIVITAEPCINYAAIDSRTGTINCDKHDAEELNLLKIDCLGLTQLSTFEYALELAGLDRLALELIPLDDQGAFDVLNDAKFCGIFQFNGMALQSIVKQFTVGSLSDIVDTTALARPGPLASGNAHEWVRRKNGKDITHPHPMFEPYLESTLGIVLYQEQIMRIARDIGDLSWEDVSSLRKAMSKSLGKEYFDKFGDKWKVGAIAKGGDPELMNKVWDGLCSYGSWSYNLSHAVSYGLISYQCCWLKFHHPFEFAAATLTNESDPDKQIMMLREMVQEGYDYIPIDAQKSTDKWTVGEVNGKRVLIGPFTNIKGVGAKTIEKIIQSRKDGRALPAAVLKLVNESTNRLGSLFPIGDAFKRLLPNLAEHGFKKPRPIKSIEILSHDYEVTVFCVLGKINPRDENEAVNVARRGGKVLVNEPTASLNLQLTDDTDTIFGKISRWDYDSLGKAIVDRGRTGKLLYVITGKIKGGKQSAFRMMKIEKVTYIGELVEKTEKIEVAEAKDEQLSMF